MVCILHCIYLTHLGPPVEDLGAGGGCPLIGAPLGIIYDPEIN